MNQPSEQAKTGQIDPVSQYQELDQRIIAAIRAGKNPLYFNTVAEEATRLAEVTGREDFRIVDGRLQALRKAGKIAHVSQREGWKLRAPDGSLFE